MQTTQSPFAAMLPRLYELKAAVPDPTHPDAYFGPRFEKYLAESEHVVNIYRTLERTLALLDTDAWRDSKERATPYLTMRGEGRGWQPLFDTLNEAKGCVRATVENGITQLDGEDPQRTARRIVFIIVNFDDSVGDDQTEYIAQLDSHLLANPISGAELAFSPASNLFERSFTMRSASIVEI